MSSNRSHLVVAVAAVLAVVASLGIGATPAAGTGATEPTEATTSVFTPIAELSKVSVGYNHACGIDGTGILYCWGSNTEGELGTGDTTSHTTPVAVATAGTPLAGTTVDAVAAGSGFTCALTATEAIACWGENANGELGNGSTTPSLIPTAATLTGSPLSGANITSLTTQHKHICARTSAGGAACWGANSNGQLGDGTQVERHVPTTVTTTGTPFAGVGIKSISAGTFHTCGVANDGAAACWGSGSRGALGDGTTTRKLVPTSPTLTGTPLDGVKVALLSASRYSTCAATVDGDLVCWGAGDDGQLANGGTADSLVPTAATTTGTPLDGADVVDIDSGFDHHCARTSTGTAVCWGDGYVGYLGTGTTDDALVATPVDVTDTPLDGIVIKELAAGRSGACIASAAKQPYCWGTHSTTGSGSTVSAPTPIPVAISSQVPTETPTITSTSVDDNRVSLEWSSVPGIGGTVPVSVVIRVYIGNDLVRTWDWPLFTLDGSGFATLNLEWDTTYRFTVAAVNQGGEGPESPQSNTVVVGPEPAWETSYHPITPCRILDTRIAEGPLANREIRDVQVTDDGYDIADQGGNPDGCPIPEDADAVEASVTAVSPSDSGFFRAWPTDESMPNATFMNFDRGMDITNTGAITIRNDDAYDQLRIRSFGGPAHYVIDIQGYYEVDTSGDGAPPEAATSAIIEPSSYVAMTPCRIVDTRQAGGSLANREIRDVAVVGSGPAFAAQGGLANGCAIPTNAIAVEASVTAVDPADSGFFRAWPNGESMPNATFMNFDRGMDITNTGAITINPNDEEPLRLRNFGGRAHYVVDIQGYFLPNVGPEGSGATTSAVADPSTYVAITPCRIVDTRQAGGSLANREIRDVQVLGAGSGFAAQGGKANGCDLPTDAVAVEASVTAVDPADSGFFRAWPSDESMPNATFMNFDRGMDITNTGSLTIDADDETDHLRIRNFGGRSHYVIDIQGYFVPPLVD